MSAPSCMAFPFRSQHSADRKHRMKLLLQTKPITYQRHQESKWEVRKKSATLPFYKGALLWERTETAVAVSFLSLWPEHRNATKVKKETGAAVSQWETVSEGLTGGGGGVAAQKYFTGLKLLHGVDCSRNVYTWGRTAHKTEAHS